MDALQLISILLNAVFGGGMIIQFFTMRSIKAKAKAESEVIGAKAKAAELDNVQEAIQVYKGLADDLRAELKDQRSKNNQLVETVEKLRKDVVKLTTASNKLLKLVENITPDNMEKTVKEIKELLK